LAGASDLPRGRHQETDPVTKTLTQQQREEFERLGVLRFDGLISADRVRAAREAVQRRLEPLGLWRDGEWRLDALPRPQWPDKGLKTSKAIGNRRPEIEALIEEPALLEIVDDLLGGRPFDRAIYKRPQVLFTLPNAQAWTLPGGWHCDSPRLASGERDGVQLFACLDEVAPRGGGTLAIAGSHRLLNEGRFLRPGEIPHRLRDEAFFRPLLAGSDDAAESERLMGLAGEAQGAPLRIVELTGRPGDAWIMDLRVLHAGAPNAGGRPRMMATHRFVRADLMDEISEGFGWV